MCRIGTLGKESSGELVLALCSAFEQFQATRDAKFDRLIVASFKVQPRQELCGAPVAPVQSVRVVHVERGADRSAVQQPEHQQQVFRHSACEALEQAPVQIRGGMMVAVSAGIAAEKKIPLG